MTPGAIDDWQAIAERLCARTHPEVSREVRMTIANHVGRNRDAIATDGWTAAMRGRLVPAPGDRGNVALAKQTASKVLGWSASIVAGRADDIPDHERDVIREALSRPGHRVEDPRLLALTEPHASPVPSRAAAPPSATARLPAHPVPVGFVHAWRARGDAPGVTRLGTGTVPLVETAESDAPVAVRLRRPDGGSLDVRRFGSAWLRPVLSPGTWEPIGPAALAHHLGEGTAWIDNPTTPVATASGARQRLGAASHRAGEGATHGLRHLATSGDPTEPSDLRAMVAAAAACADRAGTLHVIGGVVHRTTVEPRMGIDSYDRGTTEVFWFMPGDLASTDTMSTCPGREPPIRFHHLCREDDRRVPDVGLPVTDAALVRAVASRLSEGLWRYRDGDGPGRRDGEHEGTVEVTDPSAFPDPVTDALAVTALMARRAADAMARDGDEGARRRVERAARIADVADRAARAWERDDRDGALVTPGMRTLRTPRPTHGLVLPLHLLVGTHEAMARKVIQDERVEEEVTAFSP